MYSLGPTPQAREGAHVVMTDIIEPEEPLPHNCTFMIHDVTSEADWEKVVSGTHVQHLIHRISRVLLVHF